MTYCACVDTHNGGCPNDTPGGLPPLKGDDEGE